MLAILTIVHVLAALAIVGFVLIQHGRGADAGAAFGAGSAGSIFGARGPASFLTRATAALAMVFFLTSLSLAYLSGQRIERRSITERVVPTESLGTPADVPDGGGSGARQDPRAPGDVPTFPAPQGGSGSDESGASPPAGTN